MRIRAGLTVGCVAALALAGTSGITATATPPSAPAAASTVTPAVTPAARARVAPASTVRLITGDAVRVSTVAGKPHVVISPRTRLGLAVRRLGSDTYVVPTAAQRYLGRVLDPGLFDVTAAARAGASGTTVRLAVSPGSSPSVPGLSVTSRSGNSWQGHFDAAGAKRFGAALDAQWAADTAAHRTGRTLFGGVTTIAAAAFGPAPRPAQPAFPQQTLTVKALDPAGKPVDEAQLALVNVDDARKFVGFLDIVDGVAKVSVPTGRYAGLLSYYDEVDGAAETYLVPLEGITVGSTGGSAVFDTRSATAVPNVHTPRPARAVSLLLDWSRATSEAGIDSGYILDPDAPVHVAPSRQVGGGTLDWATNWSLAGNPTTGTPYTYDAVYRDTGRVPADQNHTVRNDQVARIDARYFTDGPQRSTAVFGRGPVYPDQFQTGYVLPQFGTPVARTEYVSAPPGVVWYDSLIAAPRDDDPFQGAIDNDVRAYPAGSTTSADWLRGPLGPGFAQPTPEDTTFPCNYCRDASTMLVGLSPVTDSVPSHAGSFDALDDKTVVARFRLYRNGTLVDDEPNATGAQVDVTAPSATYRAVSDTSRGLAGFASSTKATTDVTFVSGATGRAAPATWSCPGDDPCTVLPVLTSTIPLPTDLDGTMKQGTVPLTVRLGHVVGAADPALTAVTVSLTFDGGRTYQRVPVTRLDAHRYAVTLTNPASAAGKAVGLKLAVNDAAGGKLVQTVQAAYRVAR